MQGGSIIRRRLAHACGCLIALALLTLAPSSAALDLGSGSTRDGQEEPSEVACLDYSLYGIGELVWPLVTACESTYEDRKCTAPRVVGQDVPVELCEQENTFRLREHADEETWHCYTAWVAGQEVPIFGDPDHVALCRKDYSPNEECYLLMVHGEHYNGWFICILY